MEFIMQHRLPFDRLMVSAATAALTLSVAQAVMAGAPAQKPLQAPLPTPPNVLFTLDDSGSMLNPIMPELFTSDVATVSSKGAWSTGVGSQTLTPQEEQNTPATVGASLYGYVNALVPTRRTDDAYTADDKYVIDDAKRRSSQYNTIYYNPDKVYLPWVQADGTRMPYPAADGSGQWKVPLDPVSALIASGTAVKVNLSATGANAFSVGGRSSTDAAIAITTTAVTWCAVPVKVSKGSATASGAGGPGTDGNVCASITPGSSAATQTADLKALVDSFDPAVYYVVNSAGTAATRISINEGTSFSHASARTDCTVSGGTASCTKAQEMRNFATWFVYHRTRLLLAKAAISEAFAGELPPMRLGYGALNNPTTTATTTGAVAIDGVSTKTIVSGVREFQSNKSAFYAWLFNKRAYEGTGLRRAIGDVGAYLQREDNRSPWADDPTVSTQSVSTFSACRKAFHILTTDGYWTDLDAYAASSSAARANVDNATGDMITDATGKKTYQYVPGDNPRYKDSMSDMLGDVAMYYWNRDLMPKVPNAVEPYIPLGASSYNTDPAFWQHLVNYTVGLGVVATADPWNTTPTWPTAKLDADKANDLVHAAFNSRGKFFSASDSQSFAESLSSALLSIGAQSFSTGGLGVSGNRLATGLAIYLPFYNSGDWSGDIKKFGVDGLTGKTLDADPSTPDIVDPIWSANAKMPTYDKRNIYAWSGTKAVAFQDGQLTSGMISLMGATPTVNAKLINFLRGDATNEGVAAGDFRVRSSKLGDIVNSVPTYVKDTVNLYYSYLPGDDGKKYVDFLKGLANQTPLVFIGANDGMLHAFRDGGSSTEQGSEVFAFIPQGVLPKLSRLSDIGYSHQFFVDGPLTETHAFYGGQWHSILLGSMGAGGKGVFAIDISNTANLLGSDAGKAVMWEVNDISTGNMGHVFNEIEVGPIQTGDNTYQWVALIGNGSNSASNKAQLIVVDIATGSVLKTLDTLKGSATQPNGLGGVRTARNVNGVIQAAYAGDELGNVWRFNFAGGGTDKWSVAFGGNPLFTAVDSTSTPQPITATPSVIVHPRGGTMVVVATGKMTEGTDVIGSALTQTQTIYGLWDKEPRRLSPATGTSINKNTLVEQTVINTNLASVSGEVFYNVTNKPMDWKVNRGWYMDMTLGQGQRSIYPSLMLGNYVLVNTIVPATAGCTSASTYKALFDPLNGNVGTTALLDTTGDDTINTSDKPAVWFTKKSGGISTGRDKVIKAPADPKNATGAPTCLLLPSDGAKVCPPVPGTRTWRLITTPPYAQ
jgi:type IV pilus assembly protein PilY1